jgi:ribonuclease J
MNQLKIVPIGGLGKVTQNMYLYEYGNEILMVDCGIGFPDEYMPGVDTLIPDTTYLHDQLKAGKQLVGIAITHGHEDHMGALPYILPELKDIPPIWASELTVAFIQKKLQDQKMKIFVNTFTDKQKVSFGQYFKVMSLAVTHSVPDTKHLVIDTPEGVVYHGSDFKLDEHPMDGVKTDLAAMEQLGKEGILVALVDSLRSEQLEPSQSETTVGPELEKLMRHTKGKFIVTLMSSHIHRIQQIVNAAEGLGRKVVFIGRSVEQNVQIASDLKKLHIPRDMMIDKRDVEKYKDNKLCVVIAGSQGQEGSSLIRAVYGEHRQIQILPDDKVVFSANVIPGNEIAYYRAINELAGNGVNVIYPDVDHALHQSGHASAAEQRQVVKLLNAKYVMPIGGEDRHRAKFREYVTQSLGYTKDRTLTPKVGEILGFHDGQVKVLETIPIHPRTVDGLGIGDVGRVVLSDRLLMSQEGMIVLVLPRVNGKFDLGNLQVISKGFVFMDEAQEVIKFIKEQTAEIVHHAGKGKHNDEKLRDQLERRLGRKLYKIIRREPMIIPVIMDI